MICEPVRERPQTLTVAWIEAAATERRRRRPSQRGSYGVCATCSPCSSSNRNIRSC